MHALIFQTLLASPEEVVLKVHHLYVGWATPARPFATRKLQHCGRLPPQVRAARTHSLEREYLKLSSGFCGRVALGYGLNPNTAKRKTFHVTQDGNRRLSHVGYANVFASRGFGHRRLRRATASRRWPRLSFRCWDLRCATLVLEPSQHLAYTTFHSLPSSECFLSCST